MEMLYRQRLSLSPSFVSSGTSKLELNEHKNSVHYVEEEAGAAVQQENSVTVVDTQTYCRETDSLIGSSK